METKVVTSKKFSLNKYDWLKGLLMAAGSPALDYIGQIITNSEFDIDWLRAVSIFIAAGGLYIVKNLFTNTHTTVTQKDNNQK